MVLEPPLLDDPAFDAAEEHAAVSAPKAASAAVARSGRGRWAKRIVQSSPAGWCSLSTLFRWRCQRTCRAWSHFALGPCTGRSLRLLRCVVEAERTAQVDDADRLALRALARAVTPGAGV